MNSLTLGRDPESGLVVSEAFPRVSNNHATLEIENGGLTLTDHSSNGTVVNGRLVHHEKVALKNGDQILLAGDYLVAWPIILNFFPELQRRTMRFDANIPAGAFPGAPAPQQAAQQAPRQPQSPNQNPYRQQNPAQGAPAQEKMTRRWNPGQPDPGFASQTVGEPFSQGTQWERGGTEREGYNPGKGSSSEAGQLNSLTQSDIDETLGKFNLGAFLGTWAWGLANRIYWPLAIIPLSLIPYLGQILSIFLCTYLGLNGNQLGWRTAKGVSFPVWRNRQKRWVYIGAVIFIICAAIQLCAFWSIMNYV